MKGITFVENFISNPLELFDSLKTKVEWDGKSKMGFHSDQVDILFEGTGVAIVSIGESRILRFRNIENKGL